MSESRHVLVTGASGLVGAGVLDAFGDAGWEITAASRRTPSLVRAAYRHVPVDLTDAAACAEAVHSGPPVSHLVYAAVHEMPDMVAGWTTEDHVEINRRMLENIVEPLLASGSLRHISVLQGGKAYGVHVQDVPIPARERQPRVDHTNFYWAQEDYLRDTHRRTGVPWTALRPMNVWGANYGVVMNNLVVLGAYAAICRESGRPLRYPGGALTLRQAVDTRLLGRAIRWAATSDAAHCEHFNVTNGEVYTWLDLWPVFAELMDVEVGDPEPLSLAGFMPGQGEVWRSLAERHGLVEPDLERLLGRSHQLADFSLNHGSATSPRPALVSTVKIKQAGFTEVMDTEESLRYWFRFMIEKKILPDYRSERSRLDDPRPDVVSRD